MYGVYLTSAIQFHDAICDIVVDAFFGPEAPSDNKNDFDAFFDFIDRHIDMFPRHGLGADLGCGHCTFSYWFLERIPSLRFIGVDASSQALLRAQRGSNLKRLSLIEGDILDQKFAEGVFDIVLCTWVIQFLPTVAERDELLRLIARALKPSGHLILADNLVGPDGQASGKVYHSEEVWMKKYARTPMKIFRRIWRPNEIENALWGHGLRELEYSEGALSWFILAERRLT
ncbi:MAG: class I SAM-dependent methyltransferase [Deltaproteobacteria bacterium]|nr:class I SAM-dependent methyltransferase [Deltaproteobacteria bacterium]